MKLEQSKEIRKEIKRMREARAGWQLNKKELKVMEQYENSRDPFNSGLPKSPRNKKPQKD